MRTRRTWWSEALVLACLLGVGLGTASTAAAQDTRPRIFDRVGITELGNRSKGQIQGGNAPYSLPAEEMPPSRTVGPAPNDAFDDVLLRMPDTTGNEPNLARFLGQVLPLQADEVRAYSKIHFFGTTTDGGPAGGQFLLTFEDGSTVTTTPIQFRDWCATPNNQPSDHAAIGPLSQRYRTNNSSDGARCSIYHVPYTIPAASASKKLVSVKLPPITTPGTPPNPQSYLMALTLEEASGEFTATDLSGRVTNTSDRRAPTTTHAFAPGAANGTDGWYTSAVRVTLTGTDGPGGSGVERMFYRVDGGRPQAYTAPFDYSVEGSHTLEYSSIDAAGNAEGYKSIGVKFDPNPPVTTAVATPGMGLGNDGWYDVDVKLALAAGDGRGSGTKTTEYRLNDGAWRQYTAALTLQQAGDYTVDYRSVDMAGNQEQAKSTRVRVDGTAPVTSVLLDGQAPRAEYSGAVRVSLAAADASGSGVVHTEYRIGDGAWTAYTGAFDIEGNRGHRIDFRSRDLAGNVENYGSALFVIRPPSRTGTSGQGATPPGATPPTGPPTASAPKPFASVQAISARRSTVSNLRRGRLAVRLTCQGVERGTLALSVGKAVARRLGLKRGTLATQAVRCGAQGRATVTIKPSATVRRALGKARRPVSAKLTLRLTGSAGAARDTQSVLLRVSAR